eukprot:460639_1
MLTSAAQAPRKWTAEQLVVEVINEYKITKIKQLNVSVHFDDSCENSFWAEYDTIIGNAILRLSNLNEFDRIINVESIRYRSTKSKWGALQWMMPLLSESFNGLISLNGICATMSVMKCVEDFNIVCKMISRDKMICMDFWFEQGNI